MTRLFGPVCELPSVHHDAQSALSQHISSLLSFCRIDQVKPRSSAISWVDEGRLILDAFHLLINTYLMAQYAPWEMKCLADLPPVLEFRWVISPLWIHHPHLNPSCVCAPPPTHTLPPCPFWPSPYSTCPLNTWTADLHHAACMCLSVMRITYSYSPDSSPAITL